MSATRIIEDYRFCQGSPDDFRGYDGRVALSQMMRTTAALNPEASKAEFVNALATLGLNRNTLAIQFAQSRKLSMADDAAFYVLLPDGRMEEVA